MFNNLVIWTTSDCNLRCKYCYAQGGRRRDYMDRTTFENAMKLRDQDYCSLQLAGGEPLMNPEVLDWLGEVFQEEKKRNRLNIQTNACLIDRSMARKLRALGANIGVSLDGPKINDFTRGSTNQALEGIRNLGLEGIRVNLNTVVCQETVDHLEDLVDLAFYLGNVAGIGLDLLRETGYYLDNQEKLSLVRPQDLEKNLRRAYEKTLYYERHTGRKIGIRDLEEAKRRLAYGQGLTNYCYAVLGKAAVVLPNGDLYPCGSLVGQEEYYMGNVNGGRIRPKELVLEKDPACEACSYRDYCPRGCPSRLIINDQASCHKSLDCQLKKLSFQLVQEDI